MWSPLIPYWFQTTRLHLDVSPFCQSFSPSMAWTVALSNGGLTWVFMQKSTTKIDLFLCYRRLNLCFPRPNYFANGTQVEKIPFSHCCGSYIHPRRCIKYSQCPRIKDMSEHVTIAHCFLMILIWEKRRISLSALSSNWKFKYLKISTLFHEKPKA